MTAASGHLRGQGNGQGGTRGPAGRRTLALNSAAQVAGRLVVSIGRLGVAVIVVRLAGSGLFGRYVLLLGLVAIFEWLVDFGQTDIAVRRACMEDGPDGASPALVALARLKRGWSPALAAALPLVTLALGYSADIVAGAAAGAAGVLAYGLLQTDRARLRVAMRTDADVTAEVAGLIVMVPMVALAAGWAGQGNGSGGLVALMAAYSLSRLVHAGLLHRRARRTPAGDAAMCPRADTPACPHADTPARARADTVALLRQAAPLGLTGLAVALYDGLAPIMLSRLMSFDDVARYGAASRFALPVLTVVQAMTASFFPVLARRARDPAALGEAQRAALWLALLVGGGMAAGLGGGADFLLGLVGGAPAQGGAVLRWMSWLVVARAVTSTMAPLVVIAGQQHRGIWLTLASLAAQAVAIPLLVPVHGVLGVVMGYLAIECVLGIGPVSWMAVRATRVRIDWTVPVRLAAASLAAGLVVGRLAVAGTLAGGIAAGLAFLLVAALLGVLGPAHWREVARVMKDRGEKDRGEKAT